MEIWVRQKSMEVIALMSLAITAWRLYPPKNPMVISAVENLYKALKTLFQREDYLIIAEAEKNLLIYGEQISRSDQRQPKIAALLELLINFEIKSVTINPGVTKEDLYVFLDILAQPPEAIRLSGGINQVAAERKIAHILFSQKFYIATSRKNKLLASLDIPDDVIIQYITGANPQSDLDINQVREMAQDKEWLEQIFKDAMNQIKSKRYMPTAQLPENTVRMISMLDRIVDKTDQEKFSRLIAKSIADLQEDMIGPILSQDIERYFNGKLFQDVVDQLDGGKIDRVTDIVYEKLKNNMSLPEKDDAALFSPAAEQAYQRLPGSEKGRMLQQLKETEKKKRERKIHDLKQEIAPLLAGREESFQDAPLMDSLADIVNDLRVLEQHETVESLSERLAEALLSDGQDIRDHASAALLKVIESFPEQNQQAAVERLSPTLMRWIQLETSSTAAHKKFSSLLKDRMIKLIQEHRYVECLPLLNVFHLIDYGFLEKNEDIKSTAADVLHELASSYRLDFLFEAYVNGGDQERIDIGRILSRLGNVSLHRLMDMLRDQPDGDERVKILHLIKEIGPSAMSVIKERSLKDFPWYHHRNLAYLLRFMKNDTTVDVLQTLLRHDNQKVRQEALESLYLIGENERGPVFLSLLSTADDSFKMSIIEALGKIRHKEAAPVLMEMLKNRPFLITSARKDMEEVICIALGKIGTPEAAKLLTEISRQKFYSITSYPERVRKAAARALLSINS